MLEGGADQIIGARSTLRDYLASSPQCSRSRRIIRLGSTRIHHREGQGDEEATEGTTRLDGLITDDVCRLS